MMSCGTTPASKAASRTCGPSINHACSSRRPLGLWRACRRAMCWLDVLVIIVTASAVLEALLPLAAEQWLLAGFKGGLRRLHQFVKRGKVRHRQISHDLAIHADIGQAETANQIAVAYTAHARGSVDTRNPERSHVSLAGAPI